MWLNFECSEYIGSSFEHRKKIKLSAVLTCLPAKQFPFHAECEESTKFKALRSNCKIAIQHLFKIMYTNSYIRN